MTKIQSLLQGRSRSVRMVICLTEGDR